MLAMMNKMLRRRELLASVVQGRIISVEPVLVQCHSGKIKVMTIKKEMKKRKRSKEKDPRKRGLL
jgi:hypothetical protein